MSPSDDRRPTTDGWFLARLSARVRVAVAGIPKPLRGDYVMGLNRIIAGSLMLLTSSLAGPALPFDRWALPIVGWTGCGLLLFMQMRVLPSATGLRRGVGILLDVSGASIMLAAGGESTSFVYVIYLWVIIGNGFRFGPRYIFGASLASIAGFSMAATISPFWHANRGLSFGLLAGIIVLPAYSFALIRQVAEARRQAERADQAKSLFLASVSHELRTPLNAIIGTAELLARTPLTEDQAGMVATINSAADGQLSLVADVLEFSRIDAGHGRTEAATFRLPDMLSGVRAIASVQAHRKGLLVNSYITARTPLALVGDERHLREVLVNLCDNATKFTAKGSVTIAADGETLPDGRVALRLEVADTGIGIAASATRHIFELFTQADDNIAGSFGGTGLGLALCERRVRLMGGTIGVESTQGAGAIFSVCVELAAAEEALGPPPGAEIVAVPSGSPLAARVASRAEKLAATGGSLRPPRIAFVESGGTDPPPPGADACVEVLAHPAAGLPGRAVRERFATSVSEGCGADELARALRIAASFAAKGGSLPAAPAIQPARFAGLRVLVADDNAINRTIVSRMLEGASMHPLVAHDGEEALALMTVGAVDLALLDVNMPLMDGIEAAELYRIAIPGGGGIPIIALTADATPQTRERCLRAGMAACLVKPVRTADLLEALGRVLPASAAPHIAAPTRAPEPAAPPAVLDLHTLADLQGLGGAAFVTMLIDEFKRDGGAIMAQLAEACREHDVRLFRTRAHSLCSIAANVGARALRDLCVPWKDMPESALHRDAAMLLAQLQEAWSRTLLALDDHILHLPK
jgi:two-component system sensor histidine kinase RpfC